MGRKSLTGEGVSYGCALRGAWWRGGDGSWRRGRGRLWSLSPTGLKTGHYTLKRIRRSWGALEYAAMGPVVGVVAGRVGAGSTAGWPARSRAEARPLHL